MRVLLFNHFHLFAVFEPTSSSYHRQSYTIRRRRRDDRNLLLHYYVHSHSVCSVARRRSNRTHYVHSQTRILYIIHRDVYIILYYAPRVNDAKRLILLYRPARLLLL